MTILIDDTGRFIDFLEADLSFKFKHWSDLNNSVIKALSKTQYSKYISNDTSRKFTISDKKADVLMDEFEKICNS